MTDRHRGRPCMRIFHYKGKTTWMAEVQGLRLPWADLRALPRAIVPDSLVRFSLDKDGKATIRASSTVPSARTPAALARGLKEVWGVEITFHRDKYWKFDAERGGLELVPVRELAATVGEEERVPDPEVPRATAG